MDIRENTPNLFGRASSISANASGGSTLALLIAFNHLKKRLAKVELLLRLQREKHTMNNEVCNGYSSTHILERKVDQLQRTLQSKITAYNNLEATYKQTRDNEEALIKHTSETELMLGEVNKQAQTYQKEVETLKEKVNELSSKLICVEKEKYQLEEELQEMKNIPEVSVMKDDTSIKESTIRKVSIYNYDLPDSHKHLKQIEALLYENKTLRTNMYWLATELKAVKNKKGISSGRRRLDSDSLEEGRGGQKPKYADDYETPSNIKKLWEYITSLRQTIITLKTALEKNTKTINDMIFKRLGTVPNTGNSQNSISNYELGESYVTINEDNRFESSNDKKSGHVTLWGISDEEIYNLPELESASVIVPLEVTSSDDETDVAIKIDSQIYSNVNGESFNQAGQPAFDKERNITYAPSEYDPFQKAYRKDHFDICSHEKATFQCSLPLSLIHNLELQQTQTYLTSKPYINLPNSNKNSSEDMNVVSSSVSSPSSPENCNLIEIL